MNVARHGATKILTTNMPFALPKSGVFTYSGITELGVRFETLVLIRAVAIVRIGTTWSARRPTGFLHKPDW